MSEIKTIPFNEVDLSSLDENCISVYFQNGFHKDGAKFLYLVWLNPVGSANNEILYQFSLPEKLFKPTYQYVCNL